MISGEIPVLITAPHAVPHDRGQETLKPQDNNTDVIVMKMCKNLNCYGLIPLKPLADPNDLCSPVRRFDRPQWHDTKQVPFFLEATRMIREKEIEFVIDVHGMIDDFEDSVVIGTGDEEPQSTWAEELKGYFNQNGIRSAINCTQTPELKKEWFRGGNFLRNIQNIPIAGLQLEISRAYRTYEKIEKLSRILTGFLFRKFKSTAV